MLGIMSTKRMVRQQSPVSYLNQQTMSSEPGSVDSMGIREWLRPGNTVASEANLWLQQHNALGKAATALRRSSIKYKFEALMNP